MIEPIEDFTALPHGTYEVALMPISFAHHAHILKSAISWREIKINAVNVTIIFAAGIPANAFNTDNITCYALRSTCNL